MILGHWVGEKQQEPNSSQKQREKKIGGRWNIKATTPIDLAKDLQSIQYLKLIYQNHNLQQNNMEHVSTIHYLTTNTNFVIKGK